MLRDKVLRKAQLFEVEQEHHTFEGGRSMSKLDRVYANCHACDKLDHQVERVAGAWPRGVSDRRPVIFCRRQATKY